MNNSYNVSREMRELSHQGSLLAICEEGDYDWLVDGFKYACHTICEKTESDLLKVKKTRDTYDDYVSSISDLDKMSSKFSTVIFVIDRTKIFVEPMRDLLEESPTEPISSWYKKKRGMILGKKFGL